MMLRIDLLEGSCFKTLNVNPRIAILWYGDRESRNNAATKNKFSKVFEEFQRYNFTVVPVVYNDEFVQKGAASTKSSRWSAYVG
jgi:hypothetical protein